MKKTGLVLVFSLLSGCATWTAPSESVEVLPFNQAVYGAGVGVNPEPATSVQNIPPSRDHRTIPNLFLDGRIGLGQGWEAALDLGYFLVDFSFFPRIRKSWWESKSSDSTFASVASVGAFWGGHNLDDAGTGSNGVGAEHERMSGFKASNSFGVFWPNGWQVYGGPELALAHASADYTIGLNVSTLRWSGLVPGGFLGVAYKYVREGHSDILFDLKFNGLYLPANISGVGPSFWPGARLLVEFSPAAPHNTSQPSQ